MKEEEGYFGFVLESLMIISDCEEGEEGVTRQAIMTSRSMAAGRTEKPA